MKAKIFMVLRILLGIFVLVFGLNKFFSFLPMPEMFGDAGAYFGALTNSKTMMLVAIIEIVAGLALVFNKYASLMSVILMSISVNAVLFHAVLDPGGIGGALALLILNIAVLYSFRHHYNDMLKAS